MITTEFIDSPDSQSLFLAYGEGAIDEARASSVRILKAVTNVVQRPFVCEIIHAIQTFLLAKAGYIVENAPARQQ